MIEACIRHARTVLSLLVLILIAGATAYINIPKEADPDVDIPFIYVVLTQEGIAPDDAETLLLRPMEEQLRSIEGIKEMNSEAYEGGASIFLEFDAGFDADQAVSDVREAVDKAKPDLPAAADDPFVQEINTSIFPILLITLSGDLPERALVRLARSLRDELETIPAVLDVNISGDREEQVEVLVEQEAIESYALDSNQIAALVSRSNRVIAAGNLETGDARFPIKVPGLIESIDDILNLPLQVQGDAVVRFQDVTQVRQSFKEAESIARLNGQRAVALTVTKRAGENIIDTVSAVKQKVAELQPGWPAHLTVNYSQDQSEFINTMLHDLENHVITAVLLVMIIILGTLGIRSALLVGISIPGSFLTSILILNMMGLTVNIVVLFALILSVGILVDAAIMVVEYADRKISAGHNRFEAYSIASKRMSIPIISATATTLAAFLPMIFWPGIVGEFMKYLPITVITTLLASLAMALIFVPTLGAATAREHHKNPNTPHRPLPRHADDLEDLDLNHASIFIHRYRRYLNWCLNRPGPILLLALALLLGMWKTYAEFGKGLEFFPEVESDFAIVLVHARGNLSLSQQDELLSEVEQRVLALNHEFESVFTQVGVSRRIGVETTEDVIGQVMLELKPWDERRPAKQILAEIAQLTADIPGLQVETRVPENGPPVGKPIQLQLSSNQPELLPSAVATIRSLFESQETLTSIEDDLPIPGITWEISVDRAQAAKYGLDVTSVGNAIQLITHGLNVGRYRPFHTDDEVDIVIRYPDQMRTLDQLEQVRIVTPLGAVPISNFIHIAANQRVTQIHRSEGKRIHTVRADVIPGVLADDALKEIKLELQDTSLPKGVSVEFKGQDEEQQKAETFLTQAFFVALFIMAIILVTQFNSFYDVGLILFSVIMSTVGAVAGLLIMQQPFSIVVTGVGVIALAGVVVNDNIILIDTYKKLIKDIPLDTANRLEQVREALLHTGSVRLRPVVLTTITTMLGLMPMVLQTNIDILNREVLVGAPATQWWVSLATAVVFGLAFATVLTLIITPCAIMMREKVAYWKTQRTAPIMTELR